MTIQEVLHKTKTKRLVTFRDFLEIRQSDSRQARGLNCAWGVWLKDHTHKPYRFPRAETVMRAIEQFLPHLWSLRSREEWEKFTAGIIVVNDGGNPKEALKRVYWALSNTKLEEATDEA